MIRRTALAALVVLTVLAAAGCALGDRAHAAAVDDADLRALDVGQDLSDVARGSRSVDDVVSTVLRDRPHGGGIELLRADGGLDGLDDDGARVDLRITGSTDGYDGGTVFGTTWGPATVTRCYSWVLQPWGAEDEAGQPFSWGCRDAEELPVPEREAAPALDDGDATRLEAALTASADPDAVRTALESGGREGVSVEVDVVDGVLAAAVGTAGPVRDCLLGTRTLDGEVAVWTPPRVAVEPGEAGCSPGAAVHPVTTH